MTIAVERVAQIDRSDDMSCALYAQCDATHRIYNVALLPSCAQKQAEVLSAGADVQCHCVLHVSFKGTWYMFVVKHAGSDGPYRPGHHNYL